MRVRCEAYLPRMHYLVHPLAGKLSPEVADEVARLVLHIDTQRHKVRHPAGPTHQSAATMSRQPALPVSGRKQARPQRGPLAPGMASQVVRAKTTFVSFAQVGFQRAGTPALWSV